MDQVQILEQDDQYTELDIVIVQYGDIDTVVSNLKPCAGILPPWVFPFVGGNDRMSWIARACTSLRARCKYPVFVPILPYSSKDVAKYLDTFYNGGFRNFYFERYYGKYEISNLLNFINHVLKPDCWYHIDGGTTEPRQPVEWGKWSWSGEKG